MTNPLWHYVHAAVILHHLLITLLLSMLLTCASISPPAPTHQSSSFSDGGCLSQTSLLLRLLFYVSIFLERCIFELPDFPQLMALVWSLSLIVLLSFSFLKVNFVFVCVCVSVVTLTSEALGWPGPPPAAL